MNTYAANDGEGSIGGDASRNKKETQEVKKKRKKEKNTAEGGGENTTSCSRAVDEEQSIEAQITNLIATGNGMDDRELEARVARLMASANKMDNVGQDSLMDDRKARKKMKKKSSMVVVSGDEGDSGKKKKKKKSASPGGGERRGKQPRPDGKDCGEEELVKEKRKKKKENKERLEKISSVGGIPSLEELGQLIEKMATSTAAVVREPISWAETSISEVVQSNADGDFSEFDEEDARAKVQQQQCSDDLEQDCVAVCYPSAMGTDDDEFGWIQSFVAETVVVASSPRGQEEGSANKVEGVNREKAPPSSRRGDVSDGGAGCESNGSALDSSRNTEKESREDEPKMVNTVTLMGMDNFERDDDSTALRDMNMDQDLNDECRIDCMDRSVIAEHDDDSMTHAEAETDIYDFSCMEREEIESDDDTTARLCNKGNAIPHCDMDNDREPDDGKVASPNNSIEEADDENDDGPVAFVGAVLDEDDSVHSVHIAEPSMDEDVQPEHCDVIILGAGAAGIGAARSLLASDPSLKVIVIEARDRPGGRAWTSDELGSGVDLDHGAKLKYRGSRATSNSGKSIIELDSQHTIYDFDAMGSGGDDNDGVSQTSDTFCQDSHKQYRMMWNTEGFLERVKVKARDAKKMNSQAGTSTLRSFKMNHIHHEAVQFMYRVICQFIGPESEIDLIKEKLPREATYKDCLDDLACREEGKPLTSGCTRELRRCCNSSENETTSQMTTTGAGTRRTVPMSHGHNHTLFIKSSLL